ncbi:adenosylcobinamide-phosphate synthase [Sporobacter termitidis DSM 10068]|uniref:Cobalamin biosynthesis protein CobD n=1 Tax=Sporobacter termitidis DSM 10068 TaxID=1123282 RepID=A0A1M5ZBJ9_9FIRM|nr:adenosylcobinamide-phosphate synthase CbiB [Sporobacter termitidis]SHI21617.1 adenosylcobinamide-phosphate synthase [Sporobacter termitidis DSM 10068]
MLSLTALIIGFILDLIIGDPIGWPHIVLGYGRLIAFFERVLRKSFPKTQGGALAAGVCLVIIMSIVSLGAGIGVLVLCQMVSVYLRVAVESILVWQCISLRSLSVASMTVYKPLREDNLPAARRAVAEIVGRDTESLDAQGVTRAAVETVAENTGDGIIAPLLFLAVGGAPLGLLYKALNTMDSMVGYKNDTYLYFGRAAAKTDDAVNLLPARLAGVFMVLAAFLSGFDGKNAWRIFKRDRLNHKSPNSAHTEAACAGALHVRLGGDNYYFGQLVRKPTIGDDDRPVEPEDIGRVNRLLYATAFLFFIVCMLVKAVIIWL